MTVLGRIEDWILLDLDRYVLALVLVAVGFLLFFWMALGGIIDIERDTTPLLYLFSALGGGNITLITIVISINQLILSRELRSPRELQTEMHAAEEYRDSVESETDQLVVPEEPEDFLGMLAEDTRRQVRKLADAGSEQGDAALGSDLDEFHRGLRAELEETIEQLEQSGGGVFPALVTVLDADFAARINHCRWLERAYDDTLSDSTAELLDGLQSRLEQLDIARQYFKTIYIKQKLADVSKLVMSTGLVAVITAAAFIVVGGYRTTPFSFWSHLLLVPLAVAVNLTPLALLISHVLRISTVARRTAAITPFIAPPE